MDLDEPGTSLQLDAPGPSLQMDLAPASPGRGADKQKDSERFYCPYPGCNRSFAELWRLKVHYRAPPDIRGSGKERGHGTELTHCPKCGKTLKPGKHHVGCSGGKAAARQTNKRARAAEAEPPDEALARSPSSKHTRGAELDAELAPQAQWQDYGHAAFGMGAHALALPTAAHLKQERPEWAPAVPPGIIYAQPGTAACWVAQGQVNGMVTQLQAQGFPAQFASDVQFGGAPHGFAQAAFPNLPGYPQAGVSGLGDPGQLLALQCGGGAMQHLAGMQAVGPSGQPVMGTLLVQQQQQQQQQQPKEEQDGAGSLDRSTPAGPSHQPVLALPSASHHQQQPLPGGSRGGDGAAGPPTHWRDFGRIPSPPPLPPDFHSASGGGAGMLFNFSQFNQKLPRSQSHTRLDRNLSAVGLGMETPLDDLMYDHQDDGDLMQLLFGVPDELPTMATIHLHKWGHEEEEPGAQEQERQGQTGLGAAAAAAAAPPAKAQAGGSNGGTGGQAGAAGQAQAGAQHGASAAAGQQQQPNHGSGQAAPGSNGRTGLDGHGALTHASEQFLAHGGGKVVLAHLVNGMGNHAGDEHHRDLYDAETFRLLQSCD